MNLDKLPLWLRAAVTSSGGLGVFLVAFLDSSFLTFPVINDLLVISLSMANHVRMPYYALMATLGSVIGLTFFAEPQHHHQIAGKHRVADPPTPGAHVRGARRTPARGTYYT